MEKQRDIYKTQLTNEKKRFEDEIKQTVEKNSQMELHTNDMIARIQELTEQLKTIEADRIVILQNLETLNVHNNQLQSQLNSIQTELFEKIKLYNYYKAIL